MKMIKHFLWLGCLPAALMMVVAKEPAPQSAEAPDALQATASRTLLNGLRVEILASPRFPRVAIHLLIGVGTTLDPVRKAGLADLTAALLLDSVPEWQGDPTEIDRIIAAGQTFHYDVDWDSTHFFAECAPGELSTYLKALSRFVERPVMTKERFDAVRDRLQEQIQSAAGTAHAIARNTFNANLFRGNPYQRPMTGSSASVKQIIYGETVLFQRRYYIPNVSYLALVGPIEAGRTSVDAGRSLGIWIMEDEVPYTFVPPKGQKGLSLLAVDWPKAAEPTLILGQMGVTRNAADHDNVALLKNILSSPSAQTRLFPNLAAHATLDFEVDGRRLKGAIRVVFKQKRMRVDAVVGELYQGLERVRNEGPTAEETSRSIRKYLDSMRERAKSGAGMARMLAEAGTYQLGFNYYERLKQELPRLTAEDLGRTARRVIDTENLLAVYVGPVIGQKMDTLKDEGWTLRIVPLN